MGRAGQRPAAAAARDRVKGGRVWLPAAVVAGPGQRADRAPVDHRRQQALARVRVASGKYRLRGKNGRSEQGSRCQHAAEFLGDDAHLDRPCAGPAQALGHGQAGDPDVAQQLPQAAMMALRGVGGRQASASLASASQVSASLASASLASASLASASQVRRGPPQRPHWTPAIVRWQAREGYRRSQLGERYGSSLLRCFTAY